MSSSFPSASASASATPSQLVELEATLPRPPISRPPLNAIPDPCRSAPAPRNNNNNNSATPTRAPARKSCNTTPARSLLAPKFGHAHSNSNNNNNNKGATLSRVLAPPLTPNHKGAATAIAPSQEMDIPCFDLVQDPSFWTDHNVQVLIRIRPISSTEKALQGNIRCLKQENSQTLSWLGHPETRFTFDHIACETISQEKLFMVAGLPMVENCMSGYNSCMFAYGQTGSGKTYTMMGDIHDIDGTLSESCGMTPRIFEYLFMRINAEEERKRDEKLKYTCKCSFLELYNEQITDLLEPSSTNLQLREDLGKGVYVENLVEYEVTTVKDVLQLLLKGAANRKIAATNMNSESSRSHSVFTCIIESRRVIDSVTHLRFGRLNLVDLAGSERQKSSGAEGERLKEAANINKSLSTLGLVIMTLVDVAHGKHRHVPYRDSRLTFLLQDSLGGNSKTTIIANISPSICAANETLSTLKFAQRAKLIQNNAKVNEDAPTDVMALQQQVQLLKDQLSFMLKHQNFSKPQSICGSDLEQSQSGVLGDNYGSSLEGKMSDCPKKRSFPEETMRCIRATLVGSLRREKVADTSLRRLQAEIEHMNRLVRQREEDAQRTKLMLRFREEKIKRLELLSDGFISADEYLMEENRSLYEEIQLLQERIDRNPELTQFALENVRLIGQLRMFQDFYEQGEREILWAEVSELRDQLIETAQGNYELLKFPSRTTDQQEDKPAARELDDCRTNLGACLEINAKLTREIDELQRKLNAYKDCSSTESAAFSVPGDTGTIQPTRRRQSLVEIIPIRNKSEEKIAFCKQDDEISQIKNDQKINDTVDLQFSDPAEELTHAKSVIEAMEYEQLRLIEELNILQTENFHYVKLLEKNSEKRPVLLKHENNFDQLCNTKDSDPGDAGFFVEGNGNITTFTLKQKLDGLKRDLDQAKIMSKRDLDDQGSQIFHQGEFEQICQQVEVETAKVILHLQEELANLQEELQDKMISMNRENSRLRNTIESKEDEIQMLSEEWESATLQLTSFLVDGCRSLEDASEQVGSIARTFPVRKAWISEHVEKAANSFLEKERTIVQLQKSLEDAQKLGSEMKMKLSSLKGATLAITEIQQLERNENSREVIQLNALLSQKKAKIEELEKRLKQIEDHIVGESIPITDVQGRGSLIHHSSGGNIQEGLSQLAIHSTASQKQLSEPRSEETEAGCCTTSEAVHLKLSGRIEEENNKIISSFFGKFDEAQDMVKEADAMLNALLKANENAKYMTHMWKEAGEELMMERVHLIEEVQHLKSSICLKEEQYESIEAQMQSSFAEIALSLSSIENSFLQMQRDTEESFKIVYSDLFSLRQDLLGFIRKLSLSLEDIWAEIMENGFALFVLSQCYAGQVFEKISTLKLDCDSFTSRGKHCCSVMNNVEEECAIAIGGSSVSIGAKYTEGYLTENLQHRVHNLGHILELKPSSDMVSEEENIVSNPMHLISENLSLKKELTHKDVVLDGLLFDISLLQESTSSSKDIKDEAERISESLTLVRHELEVKTIQIDELLLQNRKLEAQADACEAALCISTSKLKQANETIEILSKKNSDLIAVLDSLYAKKFTVEEKLEERKEVVKGLEEEILRIASSVDEKQLSSVEDIKDEVRRLTAERKYLQEEIVSLNDRLEMASALADENEAIAVEARQESEASKVYAEQKEEEAKILEHSVEELESTINVLEKKVSDMSTEVERHYKMKEDLEMELQALKLRMLTVENFTEILDPGCSDVRQKEYQTSRILIERRVDIEELRKQVRVLEKERADQAIEIKECKDYISELLLHAEAQASQYQLKYKTLESMIRGMKTDPSTSTYATPLDKTEKSLMRTRGSSSPFRCIASLVQQMKLEKDQEMSEAMLKIGELEALACSRQKEICMLNTRLAAAENMTHDVIRDLLGVKLDMTKYANLIDGHHVQNLLEEAQDQTEKFITKEQENIKLRKKIDMLTEEGESYLEELNKKEADILAAQVTLEQLKQRDEMLAAQNEMLKMDKMKLKRKIAEMDETVKKHHGALSFQQSMKMKENKGDEGLRKRLAEVNGDLTLYAKAGSRGALA